MELRWEGLAKAGVLRVRIGPISAPQSRPAPAPITARPLTARPLRYISGPLSFQSPLASPVLPDFIPLYITVFLVYSTFSARLLTYGYHWVLAGLAKKLFLEAFRSAVYTGAKALNDWGLRWFKGCLWSDRARSQHVSGYSSRRKAGR